MIKRFAFLAIAIISAVGLAAQGYTAQTVPNVQLADATRFVSNPDGILSERTVAEIDRLCGDLRQRGLAEVVVAVVDRVDDNSLEMFAFNILNIWGVGMKGKDNGLVISVVRAQRDIQFQTGYGLEGVLPDAICKRIQQAYMVGPLGAGDFDKGVLDGVTAVYNVLTDNQEELGALAATESEDDAGIFALLALLFVVTMIVLAIVAARHNKKGGDGTGGPGAGRFGGPDIGPLVGGFLGGMLGGGGRGGFGGGGFGGGGFGGGSSGGGGARSGF